MVELFSDVGYLDKKCCETYHLSEEILMEHAALALAKEIEKRGKKEIVIVAGKGNNGADGITLARLLHKRYRVRLVLPFGIQSNIGKVQLQRFEALGGNVENASCVDADIYVDALFGSGLSRPLSLEARTLIRKLNKKEGIKIAIDVPSGIDQNGNIDSLAFRADTTVTMGARKLSLYSDHAKDYVGDILQADLGIAYEHYISKSDSFLLEPHDMQLPYRNRQNSHKGTYGHLGVLAGEKEGAGIIAASAALRFGAGLVTVIHREKIDVPFDLMHATHLDGKNALALGMGLGDFFDDLLEEIAARPVAKVIDADLFYKEEINLFLTNKSILTPHPKEFASLLKLTGLGIYSVEEIQHHRFDLSREFSLKHPHTVLILKGANKIIAYKGKIYIDESGTNALSKGGSGDVLSGMISALLAQGYHPLKAAITASLAHSKIGDVHPNFSLTPRQLIENISTL